jgi:hypothetical protein
MARSVPFRSRRRPKEETEMMSLKEFQDKAAKAMAGMTKDEALAKGICVACRRPALERCPTALGRQEYRISGMCEICFEGLFSQAGEEG